MKPFSMNEETLQPSFPCQQYEDDVHLLAYDDKKILLVGTAHISQQSVDLVTRVIGDENADCVCLELDEKRYKALVQKEKWQTQNLRTIIRNKQLATLFVNLLMASYQKKLGSQTGVAPGAELRAAADAANTKEIPISLCDRDVRITLRRAWKLTSLWRKFSLLASLFASFWEKEEVSEEELAELRKKDALGQILEEMGENLPEIKRVLIDERDIFLAEKIKAAKGKRIIAVVGAGHVEGIKRVFAEDNSSRLEEISTIPPVSSGYKIFGWSLPLIILGSIGIIGYKQGLSAAGDNLLYWILANGIPASIGAALALGHPLTILGSFVAAPITSLTPVIGAGYVSAFLQVFLCPPLVREFEEAGDAMGSVRGWWKNRLLRIFLVFFLTGLGSAIGTWVGGYEIVSSLMAS